MNCRNTNTGARLMLMLGGFNKIQDTGLVLHGTIYIALTASR